jgi:aspartyl-tRNA(Asn)/glutamyl-tRNA(Gln) amidotransferase subunit C
MSKRKMSRRKGGELSVEEVECIARLADLTLSPPEVRKYRKELGSIFDYVNLIGEMKTEGVEETSHASDLENVFREDVVGTPPTLSQAEALSNAPRKHGGYFAVGPVLERR